MAVIFTLVILIGATAVILNLGWMAEKLSLSIAALEYINYQLKYQGLLFGVAMVILFAIGLMNKRNFSSYAALGSIAAPAKEVTWLGIQNGVSWLVLGASLSFFITFGTSIFVYVQFRKFTGSLKRLLPFMPWVLLLAIVNSFSEEVVYRLGAIVPLMGSMGTDYILLISAIAFGAPHLRGMPNGVLGALMAGFLGFLLAKSVVETNGIFWAWFIHCLQDIVIFSAFIISAVEKSSNRAPSGNEQIGS